LGAYRTTRTNLALSVYFYTNLVSTLIMTDSRNIPPIGSLWQKDR
jgi:hypothetical protein